MQPVVLYRLQRLQRNEAGKTTSKFAKRRQNYVYWRSDLSARGPMESLRGECSCTLAYESWQHAGL